MSFCILWYVLYTWTDVRYVWTKFELRGRGKNDNWTKFCVIIWITFLYLLSQCFLFKKVIFPLKVISNFENFVSRAAVQCYKWANVWQTRCFYLFSTVINSIRNRIVIMAWNARGDEMVVRVLCNSVTLFARWVINAAIKVHEWLER